MTSIRPTSLLTLLLPLLVPTALLRADSFFTEDTTWRIQKGLTEASSPDTTSWRNLDFNDASWTSAPAPFFYEISSGYTGNTELTDMRGNYSCIFLRKTFTITSPNPPSELTLDVRSDDGCIVWINGTEVLRINTPDGEIPFNGTSNGSQGEPNVAGVIIPNADAFLQSGDNIIAIQALNASLGSSSDFFIAAALGSIEDLTPPTIAGTSPADGATLRSLSQADVTFSESVQNVTATDLLINGSPATTVTSFSPRDYSFYFPEPAPGTVTFSWNPNNTITDLAPNPNPLTPSPWSITIDPTAPANILLITEFLASNENGIRDDDGDRSDWIEIHNPNPDAVNLAGWSLTDDPSNPTQWQFPDLTLGSGNYLLVWASGKNRTTNTANLHASFRLSDTGEYLALLNPQGQITSQYSPAYPPQQPDISYGTDAADPNTLGYFPTPSPGQPNLPGGPGFAPTPTTSTPGGVYPQTSLSITLSSTSGTIRYTTDGSVPTESSPTYTSPITITSSSLLQVRTFEPNLLPSPILTLNYTLTDPNTQTFSSNLPVLIINGFGRSIPQDIRVPVGVTAIDTFRGRAHLTSTTPQFQGLGQAEIRGQTSSGFPKKPYNLEINDAFGNDLEFPLLGLPAESDWVLHNPYSDKSLLNNFLSYELFEKMGHYSVRRRFVEVFVDTTGGRLDYSRDYAGVYVLIEKIKIDKNRVDLQRLTPDQNSEPEISGGYMFKKDKSSPGDQTFVTVGGAGFAPQEFRIHEPKPDEVTTTQLVWLVNYLKDFERKLYANNWTTATGTNHYSHYIDVPTFVDHHWIVEFTKQIDGYRISNYYSKDRNGKVQMAPIWDWNLSLGNADYLTGDQTSGWYWNQISATDHPYLRRLLSGTPSPGTAGDPDFWQQIIDRWGTLRTNTLNATSINARIDEITAYLNEAQARDFARWPRLGSYVWPNPWFYVTPTTHQGIIDAKKSWITDRFAWIDAQYPTPPTIHASQGFISPNFTASITTKEPSLYYTTNGSDPRLPGGAISPNAKLYTGAIPISANSLLTTRARRGSNWSGPSSTLLLTDLTPLHITEIFFNPPPNPTSTNSNDSLEFIEISNTGSSPIPLAGIQLTDGIRFSFSTSSIPQLNPGDACLVVRNLNAFTNHYGTALPIAGSYIGALDNNGETLTLSGPLGEILHTLTYQPHWFPAANGLGFSLVPNAPFTPETDWTLPASWRPSSQYGGSPGTPDPTPNPEPPHLIITEALTHTDLPDLDFIEIHNPTDTEVSLNGWWLSDDPLTPKYAIPANHTIPAGGYRVYTENDFNANPTNANSFTLRSSGDEAYLFTATPTGQPSGYQHGFSFGAALNGISFGRIVNSENRELFTSQSIPTPGQPNASPKIGPIIISEFHYHPSDIITNGSAWNNPEDEFVELLNITTSPIPLYDPENPSNTWQLRDAVRFSFPTNTTLNPNEHILITSFHPTNSTAANTFRSKFNVPPQTRLFGPFSGELSNSGEPLELIQPDLVRFYVTNEVTTEVLIDRARYRDHAPWPAGADGFSFSLQRTSTNTLGDEPLSWIAATPTPGSAPPNLTTPTILTQPTSQTQNPGATTTFTTQASGPNLQYQWRHNESPIPGATQPTLTLSNLTPDHAGRYDAVVYSSSSATQTTQAILTITTPPTIHQQPESLALGEGDPVEFTVLATSPYPMSFQWLHNQNPIPNATNSTLLYPPGSTPNTGIYQVLITSFSGSITSNPALLSIQGISLIQQEPTPTSAPQGHSATFGVSLLPTATPPFSYQWKRNDLTITTRLTRNTSDFLTLQNLTFSDAAAYSVSVTDAAGYQDTSEPATLTVLIDSDADGMPDDYELAHGHIPTDPRDATADPDQDGSDNLSEYLAGTNPRNNADYLHVQASTSPTGLLLQFTGASHRNFAVQSSDNPDNPTSWTTIATFPATSSQPLPSPLEVLDERPLPPHTPRLYQIISPPTP
jgi:hypothetical protein